MIIIISQLRQWAVRGKKGGLFVPEGKLTYNSQTTFVLSFDTWKRYNSNVYGRRWSFPHQASAATYVWMPMQADKGKLSIPEYWQAWDIKTLSQVDALDNGQILSLRKTDLKQDGKGEQLVLKLEK